MEQINENAVRSRKSSATPAGQSSGAWGASSFGDEEKDVADVEASENELTPVETEA